MNPASEPETITVMCDKGSLFSDPQRLDQFTVSIDILTRYVIQQTAPLTDQLQKSATGGKVLGMHLQMFGDLRYPLGKQGDLNTC